MEEVRQGTPRMVKEALPEKGMWELSPGDLGPAPKLCEPARSNRGCEAAQTGGCRAHGGLPCCERRGSNYGDPSDPPWRTVEGF